MSDLNGSNTMGEFDGHTEGPWEAVPWHIMEGPPAVLAPEGWLICETNSDANARLIAAAPSLLAENADLRRQLKECRDNYKHDTAEHRRLGDEKEAEIAELAGHMRVLLSTAQQFERQASRGSGGRRGGPVFEKARALINKHKEPDNG